MTIEQNAPEWVIRQGFACVWVRAPSAAEAVENRGEASWPHGRVADRARC